MPSSHRYLWVLAWYLLLGFQMTYGKMLIKDYKLSNSGQVRANFTPNPLPRHLTITRPTKKHLASY